MLTFSTPACSLWEVGKDQRPISFSLPKEGENGEFLSSSDDDDDEAEAVGAQLTKTKLDNPRPTPEAQPSAPPVAEVQTLLPQGPAPSVRPLYKIRRLTPPLILSLALQRSRQSSGSPCYST